MGLFDFFKRKRYLETPIEHTVISVPSPESKPVADDSLAKAKGISEKILTQDNPPASEELFRFVFNFSEYVVLFLSMMFRDSYSPIAAYEDPAGNLVGYLYVGNDMSFSISITEVVEKMEVEFEKRINAGQLVSYVIFYHSAFNNDDNHKVVTDIGLFKAISVQYRSKDGLQGYLAFPYLRTGNEVKYKGFNGFSREQNGRILSVELDQTKDYFQEKIEIKPEVVENEAGLTIKKVNNGTVGNLWSGIFGFDGPKKKKSVGAYMALVISSPAKIVNEDISVHELVYGDIVFKGIKKIDRSNTTFYPAVSNIQHIDVENKLIAEWINVGSLEAVISGAGRDTFGVTYFATDYAENSKIYTSQKQVSIAFSGILFVLDKQDKNEIPDGEFALSEDFAGYMPNKELAEFGCYDFVGTLMDHREVNFLDVSGYMLNIKLINNDDIEDFFTIPMFVNKVNMRFEKLEDEMQLNGVFQLLGEIKVG